MNTSINWKSILSIILVIFILLLIPFNINEISVSSDCNVTLYQAALYTVVRANIYGLARTKFYFFPSNLDANNNYNFVVNTLNDVGNTINNLFQ